MFDEVKQIMIKEHLDILLIEDNPDDVIIITAMLHSSIKLDEQIHDFNIDNVETIKEALGNLDKKRYDLILVDLTLPDTRGINTIQKIKDYIYKIPTIVLTGHDSPTTELNTIQIGIQDYLVKGEFSKALLLKSIKNSITRHALILKIHDMSIKDELTGLLNRRGFFSLIEQQIKIANRNNTKLILLYIDLNNFKQINDTQGHEAGDRLLIDFSDILLHTFRDSDIIARMGGDEFVVFPFEAPMVTSEIIVKRLRNEVAKYNNLHNKSVSFSIGVSEYDPNYPKSIDELISGADQNMYRNKKQTKKNK